LDSSINLSVTWLEEAPKNVDQIVKIIFGVLLVLSPSRADVKKVLAPHIVHTVEEGWE
jgi:hypothetical protein